MQRFVEDADPDIYYSERYIVLDFEIDTSHGDYGHSVHEDNQMLLACWQLGPRGPTKQLWGGEFQMSDLIKDLDSCDFLVAHNAKYELGWLARCGADLSTICVFDTQLAEYVLSGNLKSAGGYSLSLDSCCRRRGWKAKDPVVDHLIKDGVNPARIPRAWLQGRCQQDVYDTHRLFLNQRAQLYAQKQLAVQYTRCLLTPVLADIESNGMFLDAARVETAFREASKTLSETSERLREIASINWNSDQQVAEVVYEKLGFSELTNWKGEELRTETGQRKTDVKTLQKLKAETVEQEEFLTLYKARNKAEAALTKSLNFFKAVCDKQGGLFHAEFNQTVTATHRLSSSGMEVEGMKAQFQNLPNEYKNLFKARKEDWVFCEWDGSGLEFRGAGLISGDEKIAQDILDPTFDPHRRSASIIFKTEEGKVTKDQRKKAKAYTFKPLFGGMSGTKAEKAYYESFNERYNGLVRTQNQWLGQVTTKKQLRLPWGLTFFFPSVKIDSSGYVNVRTNVFNYPIQSLSTAEIIPLALVWFWHRIHELGLEEKIVLVNTVHDSVLAEVAPDAVEQYKEIAVDAWRYVYWYFENVYDFPLKGLPLGTELTIGGHWSEGETFKFDIYQDGKVKELAA